MGEWYERLVNSMKYIGTPLIVLMTALTTPLARAARWQDKKGNIYALLTTGVTVGTLAVVNYYQFGLDIIKRGVHCPVDIVHDTPAIAAIYYSVLNGFWAGISVVWRMVAVDTFYKNVLNRNPEYYITKNEVQNLVKGIYSIDKDDDISSVKQEESEHVKRSIRVIYNFLERVLDNKTSRQMLEANSLREDLFDEKAFSRVFNRAQKGDLYYFLSFVEEYEKKCGDMLGDERSNLRLRVEYLKEVHAQNSGLLHFANNANQGVSNRTLNITNNDAALQRHLTMGQMSYPNTSLQIHIDSSNSKNQASERKVSNTSSRHNSLSLQSIK